jgi:hypothetical protein
MMHSIQDRLRNAQSHVATLPPSGTGIAQRENAWLIAEQSPDSVLAQIPSGGDLTDGVMPFSGHTV